MACIVSRLSVGSVAATSVDSYSQFHSPESSVHQRDCPMVPVVDDCLAGFVDTAPPVGARYLVTMFSEADPGADGTGCVCEDHISH